MKRDIGRPAIDTAYRIRTMAWFNAVSLASGGMTAGQLELLFGTSKKKQKYSLGARPGLWGKYQIGYICPKSKPDINGNPSIVERVEKRFPETAKWITLPFWDVLSYTPMGMADLKKIYLSLSPLVRDLIVMELPGHNMMFWRRPIGIETLFQKLLEIGDLDAFTAILALIKEAETIQAPYQHLRGFEYWVSCSEKLQQHPVLSSLVVKINMIVADRFTRVSYAGSDGQYFRIQKDVAEKILSCEIDALDFVLRLAELFPIMQTLDNPEIPLKRGDRTTTVAGF